MKKIIKILCILILLAAFWVFFLSMIYPQFHNFRDVMQIVVRVYDQDETDAWPSQKYKTTTVQHGTERTFFERVLTEQQDIENFRRALSVTWDGFVPINSYETPGPRYTVDIMGPDGHTQHLFFSNYEWGSAGSTPKRIIEHINKIMS